MDIYKSRATVILLSFILLAVAIITFFYSFRTNQVEIRKRTATEISIGSTKTSIFQTTIAPSPTVTPTFTPSPSPSSTLTPTSTSTPTSTLTPTAVICDVTVKQSVSLYQYPSLAIPNSISLPGGESVKIYSQLRYKQWYQVSRSNHIQPEGWLPESDINFGLDGCSGLNIVELEAIYNPGKPVKIILADTFYAQINKRNRMKKVFPAALQIPYSPNIQVGKLENVKLPGNISILSSFTRIKERTDTGPNSFVGFRLASIKDPGSVIELRLMRDDKCDFKYLWKVTGKQDSITVPLGPSANCFSGNPNFVLFRVNLENVGMIKISGNYNGIDLNPKILEDAQGIFKTMSFAFISQYNEAEFDYILITEP